MLIKTKDSVASALNELQRLLHTPLLSNDHQRLIKDEITKIKADDRGEREAAYHIDFKLKDSKNYAVIHDLRIEHGGRVAQIDHLIVGRWFDIFIVESKNMSGSLRVCANGEFQVYARGGWRGLASPVEQNNRHIQVLSSLIKDLRPAQSSAQTNVVANELKPSMYACLTKTPQRCSTLTPSLLASSANCLLRSSFMAKRMTNDR
jgi:Nuclease-related domain